MKENQLKGYLLEDAVQKLLEVNGYGVITETGFNIEKLHNGLNVMGRSSSYPFNSLGQLKWTLPFSNPTRLFVEAKFRENKVGVDLIREAIGVLTDINQNYSTVKLKDDRLNISIFDYHYIVFSTSGFTEEAYKMALAHKIYLIDLSGKEYTELIQSVEYFTKVASEKLGEQDFIPNENAYFIRDIFRKVIELPNQKRETENLFLNTDSESIFLTEEGNKVKESIRKIGGIYLATTNVPFLIGLVADDDQAFRESLLAQAKQDVVIHWEEKDRKWSITAKDEAYHLEFKLPKIMEDYMLASESPTEQFRSVMIHFVADLEGKNEPGLYTLEYN